MNEHFPTQEISAQPHQWLSGNRCETDMMAVAIGDGRQPIGSPLAPPSALDPGGAPGFGRDHGNVDDRDPSILFLKFSSVINTWQYCIVR